MATSLRSGLFCAVLGWSLFGCGGDLVDNRWDGGAYFVVSGPVDPDARFSGAEIGAAIAWAWIDGDRARGRVERVSFEPRLYQYALTVRHPPDPSSGTVSTVVPVELRGIDGPLLVGLPLLYQPRNGANLDPDLAALFEWAFADGRAADAVVAYPGSVVAALTSEHALIATEGGLGGPCSLDGAVEGLTLYRRLDGRCGTWEPLAPPGGRTEFQGVTMYAP